MRAFMVLLVLSCSGGSKPSTTPRRTSSDQVRFEPQVGHAEVIHAVDVSSDGRLAVTAGNVAKVWDLETGAVLRTFSSGRSRYFTARFTGPHEVLLLDSLTNGRSIDVVTGKDVKVYKHDNPALILSPDARQLVGFTKGHDQDAGATVLDLATGKEVLSIAIADPVSAALSPDNKIVAVGTQTSLVLFDAATRTRLREIPCPTCLDVRFSPSGKRVMAVGARVWSVETGSVVSAGVLRDVEDQAFAGDDRLVVVSTAGVRLIDAASQVVIRTLRGHPVDPKLQPNRFVAVNGNRVFTYLEGELDVFETASGQELQRFRAPKSSRVVTAEFSPDGRHLVAGEATIAVWNVVNLNVERELVPTSAVRAIRFVDANRIVGIAPETYADDPHPAMIGFDLTTGAELGRVPLTPSKDMLVSDDGRDVYLSDKEGALDHFDAKTGARQRFGADDLIARGVVDGMRGASGGALALVHEDSKHDQLVKIVDAKTGAELRRFATRKGSLTVGHWLSPDGKRLVLTTGGAKGNELWDAEAGTLLRTLPDADGLQCVQFVSADRAIVATRDGAVMLWDLAAGTTVWSRRPDTLAITDLAISRDRRLAASVSNSTVRLWRVDTGASIALASSGSDWVVYDDRGYFDASKNGGSLVAAVDGDRAYRIDQLATRNNRPDQLLEAMGLGDAAAIAHFRARYERRLERGKLDKDQLASTFSTAPRTKIVDAKVTGKTVALTFEIAATDELRAYQIWANGVPVLGTEGKAVVGKTVRQTETVELTSGTNRLEVGATDRRGAESLRAYRTVTYDQKTTGDLYYLAFGVSKYRDPRYDLAYAHKDVLDVGEVLKQAEGYAHVHVKVLTDREVTTDGLRAAKQFVAGAKVDDTVIVFVAGHGLHARDSTADYYFATYEVDPANLARTAAPFELVESLVQDIAPRRKLLLLDTCESGEVDPDEQVAKLTRAGARSLRARALVRVEATKSTAPNPKPRAYVLDRDRYIYNDLVRRSGAVVLSSSRGTESSYELDELRNGAFTEAILRALTGVANADGDNDHRVSTQELSRSLAIEVPPRTNDLQHPTIDRDNLEMITTLPIVPTARAVVDR